MNTTTQQPDEWGKPGSFDNINQEALLNIMRAHSFIAVQHDRLFKPFGITTQQFNILRILANHKPHGLPSQSIAPKMITFVPDITRILDRLVKAEYVTRKRCTEDRRVVHIHITPAGEKLIKKINPLVSASEKNTLGHLSKKELTQITQLMRKVRHAAT